MKLSEYAKQYEITYRSAWNRFKAGKIRGAYMDDVTGHIHVPHPNEVRLPQAAIYARVSSHPQKDDLERQADRLVNYAIARGYTVTHVVKEVASGVNDERPKLTKLLKEDDWGTLVVEHKDRLTRIGFNWFDVLLTEQGRRVDVANRATEHDADLMDDLVAILYSFAVRMYGKRGSRARAHAAAATLGEAYE